MYADTECFSKKTKIKEGEHTIKYQEHQPNSIGAKLVCIDDRFTAPSIIFKGKDCINEFNTWVLDKQKWTQQITNQYFHKELKIIIEDEEKYQDSQDCWICSEKLGTDKLRDYCKITRKYRGDAHDKYSKNLGVPK